jgi:hypothetical protein
MDIHGEAGRRILSAYAPEAVTDDMFWVFEFSAETKFRNRRRANVKIDFNTAADCTSHFEGTVDDGHGQIS